MMCFDVVSEYDNIKRRTVQNRIEFTENEKKLVFRQPNPILIVHPMPLDQFEHVCCAKLLSLYYFVLRATIAEFTYAIPEWCGFLTAQQLG